MDEENAIPQELVPAEAPPAPVAEVPVAPTPQEPEPPSPAALLAQKFAQIDARFTALESDLAALKAAPAAGANVEQAAALAVRRIGNDLRAALGLGGQPIRGDQ